MKNFDRNMIPVLKKQKMNNEVPKGSPSGELAKLQKNIFMQASLGLITIVLTIVILFAVTSAWYTNVVQTSGLIFNVEAWKFDGTVSVGSDAIAVAPGDEGVITFSAQNNSDDITAVNVSVSKTGMNEEMKKRLFFYVDTNTTRNGETMERVYLNSFESYSYTLFANDSVTLTEDTANAPRLKWHWVYDVLGYYVLAEIKDGDITVKEYLRPIEYDFDEATFSIEDVEGSKVWVFQTVDGEKTPTEFLMEVSKTDGYEGTINGETIPVKGYYPVSVDEEGNGIYAYLCTYSEIELATQWDTETGEEAYEYSLNKDAATATDRIQYTATINVSAQKSEITAAEIATAEELKKAIEDGTDSVFKLTDNITLDETLSVTNGSDIMIDLNGKTITSGFGKTGTARTAVIEASGGSSLTMINGSIDVGETGNDYAVKVIGAEVVMNEVDIIASDYGFFIDDSLDSSAADSTVYIKNCEIKSSTCSVYVSGNGTASGQKTAVVIENCSFESEWYTISGNGSTSKWGTDIQVINTVLKTSLYACIYHPQSDSTLTLSESKLEGPAGIVVKGGSVTLIDTNITATGAMCESSDSYSASGYNDTNDAFYIETNYGYVINVEIKGGVIASNNNYAFNIKPNEDKVTVNIHNGVFISGKSNFEFKENWLAEGSSYTTAGGTDTNITVSVISGEETETETTE